jgi:hypothetical protein
MTREQLAGVLNRLWAAFPRSLTGEDRMMALQVWWEQVERCAWLDDEIAHRGVARWIALRDAMPTIKQWIDLCDDVRRELEREEARASQQSSRVVAVLPGQESEDQAPDGLKRFVSAGMWDRWYAYGSARHRLRREPLTSEIDARLREMRQEDTSRPKQISKMSRDGKRVQVLLRQLRGSLDVALEARITLEDGRRV